MVGATLIPVRTVHFKLADVNKFMLFGTYFLKWAGIANWVFSSTGAKVAFAMAMFIDSVQSENRSNLDWDASNASGSESLDLCPRKTDEVC